MDIWVAIFLNIDYLSSYLDSICDVLALINRRRLCYGDHDTFVAIVDEFACLNAFLGVLSML